MYLHHHACSWEQMAMVMNLILHLWYVAIASQWLWCTTYQVSFLCLLRQLNRAGNMICNDTALVKEPGECTLPRLLLKGILKLLWVSKWCNGCNRKASLLLDRSVELEKTGRGLKLSDGALKKFQPSEHWKAYLMWQKRKVYGSVLHSLLRD